MTDHIAEASRQLKIADESSGAVATQAWASTAQAHATLAVAEQLKRIADRYTAPAYYDASDL